MQRIEKIKFRLLNVFAILMIVMQGCYIALMVVGIGRTYGSDNSIVDMVNYFINFFYVQRATILRSMSHLAIAIGFIFFLKYQIQQLVYTIQFLIKSKKSDPEQNFDFLGSQFGKSTASLVFYLFYIQLFDSYALKPLVYIPLIVGITLFTFYRCIECIQNKDWILHFVFKFLKYGLTSVLLFFIAQYIFQPLLPLSINGFRAMISGLTTHPIYILYKYLVHYIFLIICFCCFIKLIFAFAVSETKEQSADSRIIMIFAIIILFVSCIVKDLDGNTSQLTFSVDTFSNWFHYSKETLLPFALSSISFFVLTFFDPKQAAAEFHRKNNQTQDPTNRTPEKKDSGSENIPNNTINIHPEINLNTNDPSLTEQN